ncbi:sigma-70 family RNA polymerase sigma factor [Gracilibacillus salitolerans]|uniref:Sigma-70 family RNA polymerase sigma factor n=1 Tax=Gracilibacillus salitolerans TaxID=2663022 RepID=A0A5Q2THG5_9BACI|nr:RNA polymerase sigma factor [Gracilibacillus salitolerans]QGH33380.1 sigma-70 family RNA polymerase sigma factor [Gracilibacillus salitolerans]
MDDYLLLEQMCVGNQEAFDQFYQRYHQYIFQIAYKVLANRPEAEDLTQEVFIEIYQRCDQYQVSRGSVKAWIAVKVRSRAIDRLRKKPEVLADKLEDIITNSSPSADQFVIKKMEKDLLQAALLKLPLSQQQAIYHMYYDQFTQKEIAVKSNRPLGSVKSSIRYGLQNLKKQKSLIRWIGSGGGDK